MPGNPAVPPSDCAGKSEMLGRQPELAELVGCGSFSPCSGGCCQQHTLPAMLFTFVLSVFFPGSKNKSLLVWMGDNA